MKDMDYKTLVEYFEKICGKIRISHDIKPDEFGRNLSEVCTYLRVGKIEVNKTIHGDNRHGEMGPENAICFESKNFDSKRFYTTDSISTGLVDAKYSFYQIKGDDLPFTDEEKNIMKILSVLIFLFSGNLLLTKHLNHVIFHDIRFKDVYNPAFIHFKLGEYIKDGRIGDYGILQYNIQGFSLINKKLGEKPTTEILEKYHEGLTKIFENDPDKKGFDIALGGDNGFIVFRKELKEEVFAYLSSAEFRVKNEKGEEEFVVLKSRFGYNMELEGFSTSHQILATAGQALNSARKIPGTRFLEYDETFRKKFEMDRKIENWYTDALIKEEFLVYYQPKVDLHNYSLKGAEALVRWIHNEIMIYPDQFIPVLENNQTIKYLDLYMLNHVCQDIKKWLSEGKEVPQISVNLSRATLAMSNLVDVITSTIDKYEIPRSLIQIELTESASDADNEVLRPLVTGLNREGLSTAVDDFGTGFSSLSLIKELPWDVIKIDKSLLKGAHKDGSRDQLMFKSIISMAQTMGLHCIVEGVETKDDVRILKESGCYMAQGNYFSKPKPKADFEALLSTK